MTCKFCRQPLIQLYPHAPYELQWAHTSREEAADCTRPRTAWPVPQETFSLV